MKLNLGCGFNKMAGYVNVDKHALCEPDRVFDLNQPVWPFESNSVDEIVFNHSLEKLGADSDSFVKIIKEIHRICKPDAKIEIYTTHPRHDAFMADPSNVRVISPILFEHFSKAINQKWVAAKSPYTPLAILHGVDFEIVNLDFELEAKYRQLMQQGEMTREQLFEAISEKNNVVIETRIMLKALKPE